MKFILALDYELFFGSQPGTVQHCLINPIDALLKVISTHGAKLTLFVDAGFLLRLEEEQKKHARLGAELDKIKKQLGALSKQGHEIQLHIHPHWIDSGFDGSSWHIDSRRYRLHDFEPDLIRQIVHEQKACLANIADNEIFAYRAGGWCIQPFPAIRDALLQEHIWLDSTVYHSGVSEDTVRWYDFSAAPKKAYWRFDADPLIEAANGPFVEIPISSCKLRPLFFWKMALAKKFGSDLHIPFGDGVGMSAVSSYYLRKLTRPSYSVTSIDGLKSAMLGASLTQNLRWGNREVFNVMGHPKSLTPYSIKKTGEFLTTNPQLEPASFRDFSHLKPL